MSKSLLKNPWYLSAWFAVLLAVVFRLPDLFVPYYNLDEITNSLFANLILDCRLSLLDFLGNTYVLTHYLYVAYTKIFGRFDLSYLYGVNLFWVGLTTFVLYHTGYQLTGKKEGGVLTALFYATASVCFMSKDYRAVISEPLSLLPLSIAAYFYIRSIKSDKPYYILIAGFAIGVAGLFKAPAVVMIFAVWSSLFFKKGKKADFFLYSGVGVGIAVFFPVLFVASPAEGLSRMLGHVQQTNEYYIGVYDDLPLLYWVFKYVFRTLLVAVSAPLVWYAGFRTLQKELSFQKKMSGNLRLILLFLFLWFLASWFVVSIGKRIFYHYFIFLIPSLCLLATPTALDYWERLQGRAQHIRRKAIVYLSLVLLIPPLGFSVEAIYGWSPRRPDFSSLTSYIQSTTSKKDRIYVWGMTPQIYFFSERDPATTFFWSDVLAGTSAGSPAMQYMRVTGQRLSLSRSAIQDLKPMPIEEKNFEPMTDQALHHIGEKELFSLQEIVEDIENPFWKKVIKDFLSNPPVLILDTSPTGIRGFSHFPIKKYELLKRFLLNNYVYETTIDKVVVYRLKTRKT